MGIWHGRSKRKLTGGLLKDYRKKKKFNIGSEPTKTVIGKRKLKVVSVKGKDKKMKLISSDEANVYDTKTKKTKKVKILDIIENEANPQYVRQKILNKGTIIKTELGEAKVSSRPGQEGIINAVLIEKSS